MMRKSDGPRPCCLGALPLAAAADFKDAAGKAKAAFLRKEWCIRGDFVKTIISGLDDLVKRNLRLSGQRIDIKALAEKVSEKCNVSIGELRSGSRRRAAVKARLAISWIGVRELGYSGADIARFLGVTNSCVTRMISAEGKQDVGDLDLTL